MIRPIADETIAIHARVGTATRAVSRGAIGRVGRVIFMVVCLSGCNLGAASPTPSSQQAQSPADVVVEIQAEARTLQLAPGWRWPADEMPQTKGPDGHPVVYQVGYGTTWADHFWYCSWEWRLVKGGLSESELNETKQMLTSVRTKEYYLVAIDDIDKVAFNKILNPALDGSLNAMTTDVKLNCPTPPA